LPSGLAGSERALSIEKGHAMQLHEKFVIAVVKPLHLDEVLDALRSIGVEVLNVTEVKSYGRQKGRREFYRGAEYTPKFVPMLKLEITVSNDRVGQVTEIIARVGEPGISRDAETFVFDLDHHSSLGTGRTDEAAPRRAA
jgi:nitrogen regulatory protein PII